MMMTMAATGAVVVTTWMILTTMLDVANAVVAVEVAGSFSPAALVAAAEVVASVEAVAWVVSAAEVSAALAVAALAVAVPEGAGKVFTPLLLVLTIPQT